MSIDKHFVERGIEIREDNSLPEGQRTQKNVKRIISAVRAAEAEFNDALHTAEARCSAANEEVRKLMIRLQQAEGQLLKFKMESKLQESSFERLTTADKKNLLEVVSM